MVQRYEMVKRFGEVTASIIFYDFITSLITNFSNHPLGLALFLKYLENYAGTRDFTIQMMIIMFTTRRILNRSLSNLQVYL